MMITSRGSVLVWVIWLGVSLLLPPTLRAAESLSAEEVKAAARVAGLEFSDREIPDMLKQLESHLRALAELRRRQFPNSLPPALIFDPRPPGFVLPSGGAFQWEPAAVFEVPAHREDLAFCTVAQLAALLRAQKITSEELTRLSLARLKKFGPALHCVVRLTEERALDAARKADGELKAGKWRGPLHGVPCGVKDLLDMAGLPSTWGVSLYTNNIATSDATVVRKLDEAGAVIVAKFSLGELAMGDVWFGGLTRNPWKPETGSSGSSAGSASAVAAGLVPFALGSETLGSIVSPATVCGITGLRPTYGRVSRAGAMTLSFSMDKLGPLARSAEDCALVLEAIRGSDGQDRAVVDAPFIVSKDIRKLRVGILEKDFGGSYGNKTNDAVALGVLKRIGIELKAVTLPRFPKGVFYGLLNAEAAAFFDELTRSNEDDRLVQQGAENWPNVFRSARFFSAVDYIQANRVRSELIAAMDAIFKDVDVLVAPAWNGNQLLYSNLTGHPCVVVPNGPVPGASLCILAGLYREGDAVAVARAYQDASDWDEKHPDMTKIATAD